MRLAAARDLPSGLEVHPEGHVYLLALATEMEGVLATFDRTIPLKAIIGATADLLDVIGP